MAAADYYTQVYTMFVGYYGRPPAQSGLDYYAGLVDKAGGSMAVVIDDFFKSAESQAFFAGKSVEQQVNQIFQNLFGRDALPAGLNYWAGLITNGTVALSQAAYTIANNAAAADVDVRDAKVASAKAWVAGLDTTAEILAFGNEAGRAAGRDFLKTVTTSTPATQAAVDAALKAMVDSGTTNPGQTFTLTSGADQADTTGSSKNGGLITSDFKFTSGNETVTAVAGTFGATDVLADGSTTDADVFNVTDTGGVAIAASVTNIETINIDVKTANGGLNMASVTGAKNVNVTANANAQLTNVATATAPMIGLSGSNVLTVTTTTLAGTTAASTAEALSVKLNGATVSGANVAGLTVDTLVAGALETLNIESAGTAANTLNLALGATATGITKAVVTGAADLNLRTTAALANGLELNAGSHTGALNLRLDINSGFANTVNGINAEKFSGVDSYTIVDTAIANVENFGLYNIANNSKVTIADTVEAAAGSIITVAGSATNTADVLNLTLANRATTPTEVDVTNLTVANVETINIVSSNAPVGAATVDANINTITTLTAANIQNLNVSGASNFGTTLAALAAGNNSNISINGADATGALVISAANILDNAANNRGVTIKGGTGNDTFTTAATAVNTTFDLTVGGNDTVVLAATGVQNIDDTVLGLTAGDVIQLTAAAATAGTFLNGLVGGSGGINAAEQAGVEAAATLTDAAAAAMAASIGTGVANQALLFSWQGNQYIFLNEDNVDAVANGDAIVQVTGMTTTTTFAGTTFLFAA